MMKYTILFSISVLLSIHATAQEPKKIASVISEVTVYMSGAELNHTASYRLNDGKQEIVFTGLSADMDPATMIVDITPKDVTILSVSSRNNYMDPVKDNERIRYVKDSLNLYIDRIAMLENKIMNLTKERDLLFKNESIGGTSQGVAVVEIEKAANFYRARLNEIEDEIFKLRKQKNSSSTQHSALQRQLDELNAQYNPPTSEIVLTLVAPRPAEASFSIKYQVRSAGWEPKYDVRSEGITKPVELIYRANIYNNCGSDWNNVKLKLSTADPSQGADRPKLERWDLAHQEHYFNEPYGLNAPYQQQDELLRRIELGNAPGNLADGAGSGSGAGPTGSRGTSQPVPLIEQVEVSELSAEFDIPQPYTILSDAKPYIVEVSKHSLPAIYEHYAVPKMDADAFLTAKITGWNALNLVSGNASVYYNSTYLGSSYINTASVEDTLTLSMGRDRKITLLRTKKTEDSKRLLSGNTVKETFVFRTQVKNNRDMPVTIIVEDQLPVSSESDIQIDMNEISGGSLDKDSGKLTWKYTLAPGESREILLGYTVKSPKAKKVNSRKNVHRSQAKYF